MTSRRALPASDPVHQLRLAAAAVCALLALVVASPLAPPAGAAVVAAPAEQRTESILDPVSAEIAAPGRQARSRTAPEQALPRSTGVTAPEPADPPTPVDPDAPVASHVPALLPPGRAPPSHSD